MIIIVMMAVFLRRNRDHTASIGIIIWSMAPLPAPASKSLSPILLNSPSSPLNICTTYKASSVTAKVLGRYPNWRKSACFPIRRICNRSHHSLLACHLSTLVVNSKAAINLPWFEILKSLKYLSNQPIKPKLQWLSFDEVGALCQRCERRLDSTSVDDQIFFRRWYKCMNIWIVMVRERALPDSFNCPTSHIVGICTRFDHSVR